MMDAILNRELLSGQGLRPPRFRLLLLSLLFSCQGATLPSWPTGCLSALGVVAKLLARLLDNSDQELCVVINQWLV